MEKQVEKAIKDRLSKFTHLMKFDETPQIFYATICVFKDILGRFDDAPRAPEHYEADCLLVVNDYELKEFCDDFASALYNTLEVNIKDRQSHFRNLNRYICWDAFCRVFNYKRFSEFLQKNLLTCDFETYEKNGKKGFKATCNSAIWVFSWISGVEKLKENVNMAGADERIAAFQKYHF